MCNDGRRLSRWRGRPARPCLSTVLALLVAGTALLASCAKGGATPARGKGGERRPAPVTVAVAVTQPVPTEITTFGTVEASAVVAVKAEVSGRLEKAHFAKGQELKAGELLFTLDPRSFEAALQQAQAALARDTVQADNARREAGRVVELLKKGIAAASDSDKSQAEVAALDATLKADEAVVRDAELQLERCTIRAPVAGRAGDLLVDPGNLVKANDATLVTIHQVRPVEVLFSVPQREMAGIRRHMAEGKLAVTAVIPGEETDPESGDLTFIDNALDVATGTIALRGTFANGAERLWPGQYVRVQLFLNMDKDAVTVPARAIQTGSDGKYVFVVKGDQTVEFRPVKAGRSSGENTAVDAGVQPGELVVTDGHLQLTDGAKVEVRTANAKTAETAESPAKARGGRSGPNTTVPAAAAPAAAQGGGS